MRRSASGVTIVTGIDDEGPVGFACQFTYYSDNTAQTSRQGVFA